MPHTEIAIIGAGFAGASCAYFLTRAGYRDLALFEAAAQPGTQASGRNAAMARQFIADGAIRRMGIAGTRFLSAPPAEVSPIPLVRPVGSIIFFDEAQHAAMAAAVRAGQGEGLQSQWIRPAEWTARVPYLPESLATHAVWTPTDGVVDIHGYLHGLLRAATHAGMRTCYHTPIERITTQRNGFVLHTPAGEWHASYLVNAAGAWADRIATLAGARPRNLVALRRHLFVTEPLTWVDPQWPFVWDDAHGWYARPESGGLLLCACDASAVIPGEPTLDPQVLAELYEKLRQHCPPLADVRIAHQWCGLRTFAPNRRFIIEWDETAPRLLWVAGLGGHGVTCAAAVGQRVAELIAEYMGGRSQ